MKNTKIYTTNRINALGLTGPEALPQAIKQFLKLPMQHIHVDNDNIQEAEQILYQEANKIFAKQETQIFLGGDHSITYPILKAFQQKNSNPFLIVFDAHADCDFCAEEPTHEEWLRKIIEDGFPPEKIILIGVRKTWEVEKDFLKKHDIKVFQTIHDMEAVADHITEKASDHNLYISIDIDALDPAFAPAVNYPEPNGLTSKEFFYIFTRLLKIPTLKAIDITEAIPEKDKAFDNRTLRTIAKTIEEVTKN